MMKRSLTGLYAAAIAALLSTIPLWAEPVPPSVRLFEQHKEHMPQMQGNGLPYGGLSLCKLLSHGDKPQPFFALPSDKGKDTCNLQHVILAFGGWCRAGVQDPTGPHFSKPMLPSVEIVSYDEGWTVIYLNHYLKTHAPYTPAGEEAAQRFFEDLPTTFDVRGQTLPIFPPEWEAYLPLRKGTP